MGGKQFGAILGSAWQPSRSPSPSSRSTTPASARRRSQESSCQRPPTEKDSLDHSLEALTAKLDALAATAERAEDREKPAQEVLDIAEAGLDESTRFETQFDEVNGEPKLALQSNRIDAARLAQLRPRLDKEYKRWEELLNRLKASADRAIAELKIEAMKK